MKFKTRTTQIMILPEGEPIFSDMGTSITIRDDAAGEYLVIGQVRDDSEKGEILVSDNEWPEIYMGIERMIGEIRQHEKARKE